MAARAAASAKIILTKDEFPVDKKNSKGTKWVYRNILKCDKISFRIERKFRVFSYFCFVIPLVIKSKHIVRKTIIWTQVKNITLSIL